MFSGGIKAAWLYSFVFHSLFLIRFFNFVLFFFVFFFLTQASFSFQSVFARPN